MVHQSECEHDAQASGLFPMPGTHSLARRACIVTSNGPAASLQKCYLPFTVEICCGNGRGTRPLPGDTPLTTLAQTYGPDQFGLSFELYPPKTEKGLKNLFRHVERLVEFQPSCITCTYGAGGSTQESTLGVIAEVHKKHGLPVATHLTCVGSTADELRAYLQRAWDAGVRNVVALRGDPPKGETEFKQTAGGFSYANELIEFIRSECSFGKGSEKGSELGILVAGYPETHQEATSPEADLENLKRKVDAGADAILTQLFYNNADFFRFREQCEAIGIQAPLVPGILPVTNGAQIQRIAALCGAKLPPQFVSDLQKHEDDPAGQFEVGVEFATRQTEELLAAGVPGLHYYVMNKSKATDRVLSAVTLPG